MKAIAVFHNSGGHWLDFLLKTDFKHVFCAIPSEKGYWIMIDGREGLPVFEVVAGTDFDLAEFYRDEGFTVVEVTKRQALNVPLVLSNCVGMVKASLGIRALGVITPYQLYKHLRGCHV